MFGGSINLFRVFGIRVALHLTFLVLAAFAAWAGWMDNPGHRGMGLALGLVVIVLLFTCIVLHELGHSLTARRYGITVRRILLLPIGGMAEFDSIPRQPRREVLISLAGPAVNFLIALLLLLFLPWPKDWRGGTVEFSVRGLGELLLQINVIMGAFNLLPVFPMDGGRILRAVLATQCSYLKATFWAATSGKILAVLGLAWAAAVAKNPVLACLFLFIAAAGKLEYRGVRRRERQMAEWEALMRNLGGPAESAARLPSEFLHGPN